MVFNNFSFTIVSINHIQGSAVHGTWGICHYGNIVICVILFFENQLMRAFNVHTQQKIKLDENVWFFLSKCDFQLVFNWILCKRELFKGLSSVINVYPCYLAASLLSIVGLATHFFPGTRWQSNGFGAWTCHHWAFRIISFIFHK